MCRLQQLNRLVIYVFFVTKVSCEYASNIIDMDDILEENYMPGTLLVLENPTSGVKTFNQSIKNVQAMQETPDGSFGNAIETMNFHRSMMNQYLCRNFVAEQIITDMTTARIKRRMGHITPGSDAGANKASKFKSAVQNALLNDEGSSSYKDWLSKSTTLEDIYKHYEQPQNKIDVDITEEEDKGEDFDEEYSGQLSGYVYPHPHEEQPTPAKHRGHTGTGMYYAGGKYQGGGYPYPNPVYHQDYHHSGATPGYSYSGGHHGGGGGYSYDSGGGGEYADHGNTGGHTYGDQHPVVETVYHSSPPKYHGQHESSYGGKEHDLSDLFDIALTALAFLSFGLFIVHVIMCISATNNNTATTTVASMVMAMSMSPTATATGGGGTGTGNGGGGGDDGGGTTGGGATGTGAGDGMTATGTGGGDTDNGGGTGGGGATGTGDGDAGTGTGGMTATGTGGGENDNGGGTGTGGGDSDTGMGDDGGGTTGGASPGTGTGTDGGTGTGTGADADGGTGTGSGRDTFKFRLKRDIPTITNPNNEALNELARRVLTSIEAALVANQDQGVCLRKSLCENNKHSRTLSGKEKIIVPMWSLGMSWLSGRLVQDVPPYTSMLDTLKASILGLGRANCEIIYQECDLEREREKRKRKRRKRSNN